MADDVALLVPLMASDDRLLGAETQGVTGADGFREGCHHLGPLGDPRRLLGKPGVA